jgi:hypothetical protein
MNLISISMSKLLYPSATAHEFRKVAKTLKKILSLNLKNRIYRGEDR